jgi:hypothetical protein
LGQTHKVVEVATYNTNAIKFYERLGFVDTGKRISDPKLMMKSGAIIPVMEMRREAISDGSPRAIREHRAMPSDCACRPDR